LPGQSVEDIRALSRTVRVFAIVSLVLLTIVIVVNHVLPALLALVRPGVGLGERLSAAGVFAIRAAPLILFASAADRLRRALGDFVEGRFFEARAARLVREAGADVAWAIATYALIVPNLALWVETRGGGFDVRLEDETIALFGFALFVVALGRILEQAATLKAENDAIV
jgi:hypothetical protein